MKSADEVGLAILEALGIDATEAVEASIRMRAGENVHVVVVREVIPREVDGDKLKTAVDNYELIKSVPLDPFELGKED